MWIMSLSKQPEYKKGLHVQGPLQWVARVYIEPAHTPSLWAGLA